MKIILATGNLHKKRELSKIFAPHTVLTPDDLGLSFSFKERGKSYLENALGKAHALFSLVREPVLADDSGLSVPALGGEPSIYSARYGNSNITGQSGRGVGFSDKQRNEYLLSRLKGKEKREAFYVCCMVLLIGEYRFFIAQETLHGLIAEKPEGTGGFGYDPIFLLPDRGKTVASLSEEEKNLISHRGKAGMHIRTIIDKLDI